MMATAVKKLKDDDARRAAMCDHHRSILVEAGAGSGKTAVMAGRIAMMLAGGIPPGSIAAVTFTELAASELLARVRSTVEDLLRGQIASELKVALPRALSEKQKQNLAEARDHLDDLICSTIHGFCQRLIRPYPAEADIDPGASILDKDQADLIFAEMIDTWLRERLSAEEDTVLAGLVLQDAKKSLELVRNIAQNLRARRDLQAPVTIPLPRLLKSFRRATEKFAEFIDSTNADEPDTRQISERFSEMADALANAPDPKMPAGLIYLVTAAAHPDLCTKAGLFRVVRHQTKWVAVARAAGLSAQDGKGLNETANHHYGACCDAWTNLREAAATQILSVLVAECRPIVDRFRAYKRSSALLDFDDLIYAARDLLQHHEEVRRALGKRFAHLLVDEFQDTDPLQTEIFWRLCGDPDPKDKSWSAFKIRPGALFLVGDPKQAIYRFRGADVGAYIEAKKVFGDQLAGDCLSISTNFRSCRSILSFVNVSFETALSAPEQPGFTALEHFHDDHGDGPFVAALDVSVSDEDGKANANQQRDGEAEAVAELCARLIGNRTILDRRNGQFRPCRPGDIALLAPTGTDLWRYEEALEQRGIAVATQAGKGLFRRQEIQDLIALTRVLADRRDTLALGALLRGPLVGLSEEDLLDILEALPRPEDRPDKLARLDLRTPLEQISHPLARDTLQKLQSLSRNANRTTPHALLSQAVDTLRVRPILLARHHGQAERALANVDLYLSLAAGYAVRGLSAFAESMTAAWSDEARAIEGRPDAQEDAVALFTMHAAKGLEWPIVIPVNTMTAAKSPGGVLVDRTTNTLQCPVLGVCPTGYEAALQTEKDEVERERVRLWYVAATRARNLLVLPKLDVKLAGSAWITAADFPLKELPSIDVPTSNSLVSVRPPGTLNSQTHEQFALEASRIVAQQHHISWIVPSQDEHTDDTAIELDQIQLWIDGQEDHALALTPQPVAKASRERGIILHKLMEEILTGELEENEPAIIKRASDLILAHGCTPAVVAATGLSPDEMTLCVIRTLAMPEIARRRSHLRTECPVHASTHLGSNERIIIGVADAIVVLDDATPHEIIDWKSDVHPAQSTIHQYKIQIGAYLKATKAVRGLMVFMSHQKIYNVALSHEQK